MSCHFSRVVVGFVTCVVAALVSIPIGSAGFAQDANDDLVNLVIDLLSESDKDLRALGFNQVRSDAPGEAATRAFAARLPDLPPDAQIGLVAALGDRGDPAAKLAIVELLDGSEEEAIRVAAIGALGKLGDVSDVKRLVELLSESRAAETAAARASLVRLTGEDIPAAIASDLVTAPPAIQIKLIDVLTTRRAVEQIPAILPAAVSADASVRQAAMSALGEIAGAEHLPALLRGVLRAAPGREQVAAEKAVMFVCGRIEEVSSRDRILLAAVDAFRPEQRLALLPTVGRVGGELARARIETAVADPRDEVHAIGIEAISNWPTTEIAPRLIELATNDAHPKHRSVMLKALIRVAPLPDARPDSERLELVQRVFELCRRPKDRRRLVERAPAIRTIETLRFVAPYMDRPELAESACLAVVELAHHRKLREPNKAEFDAALDKVLETATDATVVDRANRYKQGQTWVRPK